MRAERIRTLVVAAGILLLAGSAFAETAATKDVTLLPPEIPLSLDVKTSPAKLSPSEPTPLGLTISAEVRSPAGGIPPALRELTFDTKRGSIDVTGLPVCGLRRLRQLDTDSVKAACRGAIVGRGVGKATVAYPENSPMPVASDLHVFNGGVERGVTTLHVRGVIAEPFSETVIGTMKIRRVGGGRYGLSATTKLPAFTDGYGSITSFRLRLERRYRDDGVERSLLTALCDDGTLHANVRATLDDGTTIAAQLLRVCTTQARGPA